VAALAAVLGILIAFWPQTGPVGIDACPYLQKTGDGLLDWKVSHNAMPLIRYVAPYLWLRDILDSAGARTDAETGLRLFTPAQLLAHNGSDLGLSLLLCMNAHVFDVGGKGWMHYGPDKGYSVFAGRDATRSLALGSLEESDLALGGDTRSFNQDQLAQLTDQHDFYLEKYPLVGLLEGARMRRIQRNHPLYNFVKRDDKKGLKLTKKDLM
jgi:membrane-associated progesterone receptor component